MVRGPVLVREFYRPDAHPTNSVKALKETKTGSQVGLNFCNSKKLKHIFVVLAQIATHTYKRMHRPIFTTLCVWLTYFAISYGNGGVSSVSAIIYKQAVNLYGVLFSLKLSDKGILTHCLYTGY